MSEGKSAQFDPTQHLSNIKGQDYLEVKWRLVWFRDVYPEGSIETEVVYSSEKGAMFKAKVTAIADGKVVGVATGHKQETPGDFGDYPEKAETGSIGRALAALGFGTQFTAQEFEEGTRIVDSPVNRPQQAPQQQQAPPQQRAPQQQYQRAPQQQYQRAPQQQQGYGNAQQSGGITGPQTGKINAMVQEKNLSPQDVGDMLNEVLGRPCSVSEISKQEASKVIDALMGS